MILLICLLALIGPGLGLAVGLRLAVGPAEDALQYVLVTFGWPVLLAGVMFEVAREIRAERREREQAETYLDARLGR